MLLSLHISCFYYMFFFFYFFRCSNFLLHWTISALSASPLLLLSASAVHVQFRDCLSGRYIRHVAVVLNSCFKMNCLWCKIRSQDSASTGAFRAMWLTKYLVQLPNSSIQSPFYAYLFMLYLYIFFVWATMKIWQIFVVSKCDKFGVNTPPPSPPRFGTKMAVNQEKPNWFK